jgi:hypothetical protein
MTNNMTSNTMIMATTREETINGITASMSSIAGTKIGTGTWSKPRIRSDVDKPRRPSTTRRRRSTSSPTNSNRLNRLKDGDRPHRIDMARGTRITRHHGSGHLSNAGIQEVGHQVAMVTATRPIPNRAEVE